MGNRIEHLFQEWHKLGGSVLLTNVDATIAVRSPEKVIAESTAFCRSSGRLTWVVLDWLIQHIDELKLLQETKKKGDLSVLGVLCDAAHLRKFNLKYERIIATCPLLEKEDVFFYRVSQSPLATRLTRENALEVFHNWNYICNELRYLS